VLGAVIADGTDDLAGDAGDIDVAGGGDLAHNMDKAGGTGGLAGDAGAGVLRKNGVEDGVGNLVADFIGMPLGDGFGREKNFGHTKTSLMSHKQKLQPVRTKSAQPKDCAPKAYLSVP